MLRGSGKAPTVRPGGMNGGRKEVATRPDRLFDAGAQARQWLARYRRVAGPGDVAASAAADGWAAVLGELAAVAGGDLAQAGERARRHAADIATGFRVPGEAEQRAWPLSPVPLLIDATEWRAIEAGVIQRARLLEAVTADLYGEATLVRRGLLPAAAVTGSTHFLRPMIGLVPPGGHHLHFVAVDLARGPDGGWRVLADHLRGPVGAGYALENRLAISRLLGGLQLRLNVRRHAPFYAAWRDGIGALCRRAEPRIGLLTAGRWSASYPEQAHLARYLGFLLVEGADLAALDDRLYVRTIGGLKRVDAVWRRIDARAADPLAFDSRSQIGVPGLVDAYAAGGVVVANAPGAGLLEAPAFAAFLPRLAREVFGETLSLPSIATWWCGDEAQRRAVEARLDERLVAPAFGGAPLGLPAGRPVTGRSLDGDARARLLADLDRRPQDYVGQEMARLSTMPVVVDGELAPRPFTLRVFAARGADGEWRVLPGGFARIGAAPDPLAAMMGEGAWSADVCVHEVEPQAPVSLLPDTDTPHVRRNPGTLPSRVADDLFWLGRYLERGEALLTAIRTLLGHSIDADGGAGGATATVGRLVGLIAGAGAAAQPPSLARADLLLFARAAMEDEDRQSVRAINRLARAIGEGSRDRLSADMVRLLAAPFPLAGDLLDRAGSLQRRYLALAGLGAEHMGRTAAWRFLDLGRRIERGAASARVVRLFGHAGASSDDLSMLLDLADSQISYRQRYLTGLARVPVIDLVALDPGNPRSLACQVERIAAHLAALPVLVDDGMAEPQQLLGAQLRADLATIAAATLDPDLLGTVERRLAALSDAVARRYFLQGAEPLRAGGLTLA